jgi:hypothetical protein
MNVRLDINVKYEAAPNGHQIRKSNFFAQEIVLVEWLPELRKMIRPIDQRQEKYYRNSGEKQ